MTPRRDGAPHLAGRPTSRVDGFETRAVTMNPDITLIVTAALAALLARAVLRSTWRQVPR